MTKILRYTEYAYLAVAVLSLYKIATLWAVNPQKTYLFIFFAVVSLAMFGFRRRYRKRFEQHQKDKQP